MRPFRAAGSRRRIAGTAVLLIPDCRARVRQRRWASEGSRRLLDCVVSMMQVYIILNFNATLLLLRSQRTFLSALKDGAPSPQNPGGTAPRSCHTPGSPAHSRQMHTPPLGRLLPVPRRRSLGRGHRPRRLAKLGEIRDSQGIGQGCGPRPNATRSAPPQCPCGTMALDRFTPYSTHQVLALPPLTMDVTHGVLRRDIARPVGRGVPRLYRPRRRVAMGLGAVPSWGW